MDAFDDVQKIVQNLPIWQQVLFGKIVDGQEITNDTIEEILTNIISGKYDKTSSIVPEIKNNKSVDVRILEVKDIVNVNKLSNKSHLVCDKDKNLTIIYGGNGTGKTGYGRIFKNCCDISLYGGKTDKIIGNVYKANGTAESQATIVYSVKGEKKEYSWSSHAKSYNSELAKINVFDDTRGKESVENELEISYKPYGVSFLEKLIANIDNIRNRIVGMISSNTMNGIEWLDEYTELSEAKNFIEAYSMQNDKEIKHIIERIEQDNRSNKPEDIEKLTIELATLKSNAPSTIIRQKSTDNRNLSELKTFLDSIASSLTITSIDKYNSTIDDLNSSKENAKKAKELTFNEKEFLKGTGDDFWKKLWTAAKEYFDSINKETKKMQALSSMEKCVLCQQDLDANAIIRVKKFEEYFNDRSQEELEKAQSQYERIVAELKETFGKETLKQKLKPIETGYNELFNIIDKEGIAIINQVRNNVLQELENGKPISTPDLDAATIKLKTLAKSVQKTIDDNDEKIRKLNNDEGYNEEVRKVELKIKKRSFTGDLKKEKDKILSDICIWYKNSELNEIKSQCQTTNLSKKAGELYERYVIGALAEAFKENLSIATNGRISCHIEKGRTSKGKSSRKIVLDLTESPCLSVNTAAVLSDGEADVVAFVGFLSELRTYNNYSAIIIEDPVSSIDHVYSGSIAKLICEESTKRQIIVFTHNALFLTQLQRYAEDMCISPDFKTIHAGKETGIITEGAPLEKMTIKNRIKELNKKLQELEALYNNDQLDKYREYGEKYYGLLRNAWERFVEDILFGGVLQRFDDRVQTQKLKRIKATKDDFTKVEQQMSLCSSFCHDSAQPRVNEIGNIESLRESLSVLRDMYNNLNPDK